MRITNMITVYSKASEVIGWVGKASPDISQALVDLFKDENCKWKEDDAGFKNLLRRPWFRRVWVRQEVFAAAKLFLQCGDRM